MALGRSARGQALGLGVGLRVQGVQDMAVCIGAIAAAAQRAQVQLRAGRCRVAETAAGGGSAPCLAVW